VRYEVDVAVPYRLDLTVSVLRRLSTNIVDVLTPQGQYVRALAGFRDPVVARVAQTGPDALAITIEGAAAEHVQALAIMRRMLGVDRDLSHFDRAAQGVPWLRPLAIRMRGVKPPRYPTLWEACVNAIVFQQVSLVAASSILRRMIMALGAPIERDDIAVRAFPSVESFQCASAEVLRSAGLSANKLAALRRVADALLSGAFDEASLEGRPSTDAATLLGRIKGIGPWTATVILLRGLGRLDVFPMNDTSVARNLAFVAGAAAPIDVAGVLAALGPQRGMLYYHLLLARLEARGEVGRASVACGASGR
jgi:DNA-3-methyladenine glycosylase II